MAITRTKEVTIADAWANDDGDVTLELKGRTAPVSIVEAAEFAAAVMGAAWDAAVANAEKDGELAVQQMRDRMAETRTALDDLVPAEGGRRQKYPSE